MNKSYTIIAYMLYNHIMKGFTLIEILVVITIAVILFAIVVSGFSGLRQSSDLTLAVDDSISFLQEARAKTLSSENNSIYGVHFETSQFVLFVGNTYNPADSSNKVRALPSTIEISSFILGGGGADVIFKRLTGETGNDGTVTFRQTSNPSVLKVIQIPPTGLAGVQ